MSGIEVVGLILGALPLIIKAIELWGETARYSTQWWKMRKEFTACLQDLRFAEHELEGNVKRLLLPLLVDDGEIELLMRDPGGARWSDKRLEASLEDRLPKSYDLFVGTVRQIDEVKNEVQKELGFHKLDFVKIMAESDSGASSSFDRVRQLSSLRWQSISAQMQRVKFAHRRANRERLFKQLSHYNKRLRKLLDTQDQIVVAQRSRDSQVSAGAPIRLLEVRRHACHLYELLGNAFQCRCRHLHHLRLWLLHPPQVSPVEFCLSIRHGASSASNGCWSNKTIKAKTLEFEENVCSDVTSSPTPNEWYKATKPAKSALRTTRSMPKASNNHVVWKGQTVQREIKRPRLMSPGRLLDASDLVKITDMCQSLTGSIHHPGCIGCLRGADATFSIHVFEDEVNKRPSGKVKTLGQLLRERPCETLGPYQRYRIALALASTHFQLSPSPWIHTWSKDTLLLQADSPTQIFIAHQIRDMAASSTGQIPRKDLATSPAKGKEKASLNAARPKADAMLQTLGVVLTELCFGETVESQRSQASTTQNCSPELETSLNIYTARELAWDIELEAGEGYANAVEWCLRTRTEDDSTWRNKFWTKVVEPLQWTVEQFEGHTPSRPV